MGNCVLNSNSILLNDACKNGDLELVKYLVEKGVHVDDYAIRYASEYGHFEIVKYLFEKGAPISDWAISNASENGHFEIVKYLFKKGAPIDEYAISFASGRGHYEIVKYLVSVNAPRFTQDSEKISVIINNTRKYRTLLLPILEYKLGHPSYIVLDYLEYSL